MSVTMETALMFGQNAFRLVYPQRGRGLGASLERSDMAARQTVGGEEALEGRVQPEVRFPGVAETSVQIPNLEFRLTVKQPAASPPEDGAQACSGGKRPRGTRVPSPGWGQSSSHPSRLISISRSPGGLMASC